MGVRNPSAFSSVLVNTNIPTTTETVVATTGPLSLPFDGSAVMLFFYVVVLPGTAAAFIGARLRRNPSNALVNTVNGPAVTPAFQTILSGCYPDFPGLVTSYTYSLALQQSGATGNGTVVDAAIIALVL